MHDFIDLTLPRRRPKSAAGWGWVGAGLFFSAWMAYHAMNAPYAPLDTLEQSFSEVGK